MSSLNIIWRACSGNSRHTSGGSGPIGHTLQRSLIHEFQVALNGGQSFSGCQVRPCCLPGDCLRLIIRGWPTHTLHSIRGKLVALARGLWMKLQSTVTYWVDNLTAEDWALMDAVERCPVWRALKAFNLKQREKLLAAMCLVTQESVEGNQQRTTIHGVEEFRDWGRRWGQDEPDAQLRLQHQWDNLLRHIMGITAAMEVWEPSAASSSGETTTAVNHSHTNNSGVLTTAVPAGQMCEAGQRPQNPISAVQGELPPDQEEIACGGCNEAQDAPGLPPFRGGKCTRSIRRSARTTHTSRRVRESHRMYSYLW